jgi:signal peptidase
VINPPPDADQQPLVPPQPPSSAEVERLRRHSIQVLSSVAAALAAAAHERARLQAEIRTAQETLQHLADERERAEAALADTRAQLDEAAAQVAQTRAQRVAILSDVENALTAGLQRRAAMQAEVAVLEQRRAELANAVATSLEASPTATVIRAPTRSAAAPPLALTRHAPALSAAAQLLATTRHWSWPGLILAVHLRIQGLVHLSPRPLHPVFRLFAALSLIALLLALVVLLTPLTQLFGGLQLLAVTTGSMAPTIPVGAVVAIRPVPASDLQVGDAITFVNRSAPDVLITHRIVSLEQADGQTMLTTKGDANSSVDAQSGPASRAVGRVEFALPWLGYVMVWLGSPVAKAVVIALAVLGLGFTFVQNWSGGPRGLRRFGGGDGAVRSLPQRL